MDTEERLALREKQARARVEAREQILAARQRRRDRWLFRIRQAVILVLFAAASLGVMLIMTVLINGVGHLRGGVAG